MKKNGFLPGIFPGFYGKITGMKKYLVFLILSLIAVFFIWQGIFLPPHLSIGGGGLPKDINSSEEKLFSIEKGQGLFEIAENLEKQALVKNRFLFSLYIISQREQGNLQAGDYFLVSSMNIQKNSTFQSAPPPTSGIPTGTVEVYATNQILEANLKNGYFYVDVISNFENSITDNDNTTKNTVAIVSNYYNANSFTTGI